MHDALNCLLAYMKFAPEIKATVFKVQNTLLDKVQLNKVNLRDATMNILQCILKRDKTLSLFNEVLKRFKKNSKLSCFAMEIVIKAI